VRVMAAVLFATVAFQVNAVAFAEGVDEQRGDEAPVPYNRHQDPHHGHNHVYPDRGAIFRELPRRAVPVNYAGVSYRFADGIWFEPRGPAFIVVAPPIGLMVPSIPGSATTIQEHGEPYLYANDVYYRARPDLGGYEVVNDPVETAATTPDTASSAVIAPASASAAAAPAVAVATALPTVAATSVSAAVPASTAAPAVATAAVPSAAPAAAPAAGAESILRASPPPLSSAESLLPPLTRFGASRRAGGGRPGRGCVRIDSCHAPADQGDRVPTKRAVRGTASARSLRVLPIWRGAKRIRSDAFGRNQRGAAVHF
jgi:hypothetical protein